MYVFRFSSLALALFLALAFAPGRARTATQNVRGVASPRDASSTLASYLAILKDPALARASSSKRTRKQLELQALLEAYAPRLWWHSLERFPPTDPVEFVRRSSLHYRNRWGRERTLASRGELLPEMLGMKSRFPLQSNPRLRPYQNGFLFNGSGYYLKEEGDPNADSWDGVRDGKVPILWRLGGVFDGSKVLIEYWYHVSYNQATRLGIGNHQGDWEGFSMLIQLGTRSHRLRHRLIAAYFSEHETGVWRCARELTYVGSHLEAFSALGTHATYPSEGIARSSLLNDWNERGRSWDTWKNIRPLELEPYYGYSGAWGEARFLSFMTGPLVPGPGYKHLPRSGFTAEQEADLERRCASPSG